MINNVYNEIWKVVDIKNNKFYLKNLYNDVIICVSSSEMEEIDNGDISVDEITYNI